MGDSTTLALNLTFFGTLGVAFLMFLGLFLLVVATLVLAGVGRFLVLVGQAVYARLPGRGVFSSAARREPPVLAEGWSAAVAEADARAMARARAAAPQIRVSARELPAPSVPAAQVEAVAPLVESALHRDVPGPATPERDDRGAARSFTKPPAAAPMSRLDTGSLVSLAGHAKSLKAKLPADT